MIDGIFVHSSSHLPTSTLSAMWLCRTPLSTDNGIGHVTCWGQRDIGRCNATNCLKWACAIGLVLSCCDCYLFTLASEWKNVKQTWVCLCRLDSSAAVPTVWSSLAQQSLVQVHWSTDICKSINVRLNGYCVCHLVWGYVVMAGCHKTS